MNYGSATDIGPFVGHVTQHSARLWVRAGSLDSKNVTGTLSRDGEVVAREDIPVLREYDNVAVVDFDNLSPGTPYEFIASGLNLPPASFRTDSPTGGLRFMIGSCRYLFWDNPLRRDGLLGDRIFHSMLTEHHESPLDFALFLGDQIYADPLNFLWRSSTTKEYFALYRKAFGQPGFQKLLRNVPAYMIMDDHEIRDGWSLDDLGAEESRYMAAMQAYNAYQHFLNPTTAPGVYHYFFERRGLPFFVIDTRTERRKDREMLNFAQMDTLKRWLLESRGKPVRFIASNVPFFPDEYDVGDGWGSCARQRGELLEFIRAEKIGPVIFLGGDAHAASVSEMTCENDPEFYAASVVSSPLFWPYGFGKESRYRKRAVFEHDESRFEYKMRTFVGANNYVALSVSADPKAGIGVQIWGTQGELLETAQLKLFA